MEIDINRLCVECKSTLMEQIEKYYDYYINFE